MAYSDSNNREKARQGQRSASPEEVDEAISLILDGFGGRAASPDRVKAYAIALEGLSAESIARGVKAILRGEIASINPAYAPTAAQLAQACKPITFLSPGWVALENLQKPEQIEGPQSEVDRIIAKAVRDFPDDEEDE